MCNLQGIELTFFFKCWIINDMAKITNLIKGSILKGLVRKGDEITHFCDKPFVDILDYIYADSLDKGNLTIKSNGRMQKIDFVKENQYDTLGLEFDESVEITPKVCCNNCIFCFVQQLPKGLRDTLYVKDDDYRLSFISGSYITCTNLRENDIQRIIDYKLSPLYVSVHATDEDVRKFLLGIKKCCNQMEILGRLINNGIKIHAQIVIVGGINDGEVLKKSLFDLYEIGVETVAVVPVGLTGHREGKYEISPLTKEQAIKIIDITEEFYKTHIGFSYCSDEMYQIAEKEVKDAEYYGTYEQIENGVGLIAKFLSELELAIYDSDKKTKIKKEIGVFTGVSGQQTIEQARKLINEKFPDIKINIYVVQNNFFGKTVTVTGLVTATDIINQYGNKKFTEKYLIIPKVMLKEFKDIFLDGTTLKTLSKRLNKKILVSACTGESFYKTVINGGSN